MAFPDLDWRRLDVWALAACAGIATITPEQRDGARAWLERNGYVIHLLDCAAGVDHLVREMDRLFDWQGQFGYRLAPDSRNLDALRDGFNFDLSPERGAVLELLRPDLAWEAEDRWTRGLLSIAQEYSRHELALGKRFFTLLVVPSGSPFIGVPVAEVEVPCPFWPPGNGIGGP